MVGLDQGIHIEADVDENQPRRYGAAKRVLEDLNLGQFQLVADSLQLTTESHRLGHYMARVLTGNIGQGREDGAPTVLGARITIVIIRLKIGFRGLRQELQGFLGAPSEGIDSSRRHPSLASVAGGQGAALPS